MINKHPKAKPKLVGLSEIAELAGVSKQAVSNWSVRDPDFPAPIVELASGKIWDEIEIAKWLSECRYQLSADVAALLAAVASLAEKNAASVQSNSQESIAMQNIPVYEKSRLWFVRDVIEPLKANDRFGVRVKDVGLFVMTKADFYAVFDNVVATASYQESGHYHYTQVPKKAMRFLTV